VSSPAAQNDPYLLALPGPGSSVVLFRWISAGNTQPGARYADPVWPLAPLIDNPATRLVKVHWRNCPAPLLGQVKLAAWTMINGQLRPTYLQGRGAAARPRASAGEIRETCSEWMRLARWLHERRITSLGECTTEVWRAYLDDRWTGGVSRRHAERVCTWLSDLWAFDQLSARPAGVARPPWEDEGVDDFLPAPDTAAGGENATEPLDPQVLGPLLVWAVRFTADFADDILAAWAERLRLTALATSAGGTPASRAALEEFLLLRIRSGGALPTVRMHGRRRLAATYVSALTGASFGQIDRFTDNHQLSALVAGRPGSSPLQVEVSARIGGKPWREHMDFGEAPELMRHLGTAAAIICLYLTGMRPQEVQGLRSGCCPDPEPAADGAPGRHLIRSRHYKNVTDDDDNHISAGTERDVPWVAITPVVRAIRILERMIPPGELLLSGTHHDFALRRGYPGALKYFALNKRIEDFTIWANHTAEALGLPEQAIPQDPHGRVGLARFRRSLAWHIGRRPGGLIALAIQYGHMRTALDARTSSGYGSRSRGGIHSVLDIETALAAADTAAKLRDQAAAGEKVSGPAARRALTAAATTPRFEGRIVPATFATKAAAFLARDGTVLFDNPDALLICAFERENALCEPAPEANAPRQYDYRPGCGNAVRTDTHARLLRERAAEIDQLATAAPGPIARRLTAAAARLRNTATTHETTAQPVKDLT
jgi:hypothetical protein